MKTKCIIIDDEPIAIKVIRNHLQKLEDLEIVAECKNAIQAFEILRKSKIDLMFLDIQMPEITGLEFLKTINNPPKVIFVTAYRDYAIEGFELDVVDYLLKPVTFERFLKSVNKYYQSASKRDIHITSANETKALDFIYVKENKRIFKVYLSNINYLESMKEYVRIHTDEKKFVTKNSMTYFENKLPKDSFVRVHRSFIVSILKINSFNSTTIEVGKITVPISRKYKLSALAALNYAGEI